MKNRYECTDCGHVEFSDDDLEYQECWVCEIGQFAGVPIGCADMVPAELPLDFEGVSAW